MEGELTQKVLSEKRPFLEDLLKRKFFFTQSFDIYGGVAGLYDYGPPGCAIKNNVEQYWREHFVLEENMLEINATCLTPENVFVASGHVEKFCDFMVKDQKNNQVYRADKYLEEWIDMIFEEHSKLTNTDQNASKAKAKKGGNKESVTKPELKQPLTEIEVNEIKLIQANAGGMKREELAISYQKLKIKSRDGNDFTEPQDFNLMFQSQIGPTGTLKGYLRPETAQGIFVNFKNLLNYNNGKLPFAGAQIGLGFRNEIAPRAGLLRVREFQMAEIEHFVDPQDKSHPKFDQYKDYKLPLFSQDCQYNLKPAVTDMTLEQAVQQKIIDNETLAYFICRTYLFLINIGVLPTGIRFRQHLKEEMAHYASDCWDAEIITSYGWIECVGIADRSCYDLQQHMKHSKEQLLAARKFDQPIQRQVIKIDLNKQLLGKSFKKDQEKVQAYFEELTYEKRQEFKQLYENQENKEFTIVHDGQQFVLTREMITKITETTEKVSEEKYTPSVIEPSFGIGRILYSIFEHRFKMRDEQRTYLDLPPRVAPVKVSILTVVNSPEFQPFIVTIRKELTKLGISSKIDDGGASIGKRYARTDEIGIPFGLTLDKQSTEDNTITIRELNTMDQIRVNIKEVPELIQQLVNEQIKWSDVIQKYPKFVLKSDE